MRCKRTLRRHGGPLLGGSDGHRVQAAGTGHGVNVIGGSSPRQLNRKSQAGVGMRRLRATAGWHRRFYLVVVRVLPGHAGFAANRAASSASATSPFLLVVQLAGFLLDRFRMITLEALAAAVDRRAAETPDNANEKARVESGYSESSRRNAKIIQSRSC